MDDQSRIEIEAAAFRSLVAHLQDRTDVQNIDMMNLTGFCRNCLSRWYMEAAIERDIKMSKDDAREHVHGMPYEKWKSINQIEADDEKQAAFKVAFARTHGKGADV
ncbi:alkaline phosphatase [Rhodobacterales bacterium 52_120_T64]|nr:alkaline phosphatase [Rhodobacterales bacterium 52_120_T64]